MKPDAKSSSKLLIQLKRPYGLLVLAIVLIGGVTAFFFHRASTNDRGLIINGIIKLGPGGADIFYAVLGLLSLVGLVMAALSLLRCRELKEFRILIGKKSVKIPPSPLWKGGGEVTIPIDRILAVEMQPAASPVSLVIHEIGRRHSVPARWFPEGWPVRDAAEAIIERVRQVTTAADTTERTVRRGGEEAGDEG